ncbi:MAG: hypothetical protein HRT47_13130 [Candidatus Caenarcaniphilales bacterium]|nr:hypothetical protein [Candidatus Caenarcaniphilales bacterium]
MKRILALVFILMFFFSPVQICAEPIKLGVMETTPVYVVAEWPVNKYTQEGEHFVARVVEDVVLDSGEVLIPKQSKVNGTIVGIQNARVFRRSAKIQIKFDEIVFPDQINRVGINADGSLVKEKHQVLKAVGEASRKVLGGAAMGAFAGFRFAGILGSSLDGSNIVIGAGAGAGIALVSFIAAKGKELKIEPGLPMTLSLINMEETMTKEQVLKPVDTMVSAEILKNRNNKLKIVIENKRADAISLTNLKVVDSLGYVKPVINTFNYFDKKMIPAYSKKEYDLELPNKGIDTRRWLVLTDSFERQEFFRLAI